MGLFRYAHFWGLSREADGQAWETLIQRKHLKLNGFYITLVLPPPTHLHP